MPGGLVVLGVVGAIDEAVPADPHMDARPERGAAPHTPGPPARIEVGRAIVDQEPNRIDRYCAHTPHYDRLQCSCQPVRLTG